MTPPQPVAVPRSIRLDRAERRLHADFGPEGEFAFSAEYLRVHSPSAEVQGHGPGERKLVAGKRDVGISAVEPVGRYAVRLRFDDGHSTGIYSWAELLRLGREQDRLWADYLARLRSAGAGREAK